MSKGARPVRVPPVRKKAEDMRRVNMRVSGFVYDWFKRRSEQTGVPMGYLMFLMMEQGIREQEGFKDLPQFISALESLKR